MGMNQWKNKNRRYRKEWNDCLLLLVWLFEDPDGEECKSDLISYEGDTLLIIKTTASS